jgi:hypothetical protein
VADRKPPRRIGDDRTTLVSLLQYQRDSLVRKVAGVADADAAHAAVPSGTSLLWLIKHMARAETTWVLLRFAGLDEEAPDDTVTTDDRVEAAVARYRAVSARVDTVIAAHGFDERCRRGDGGDPADLRWVVSHLLEETARHAGHADIIREVLDGSTGR